MDPARYFLLAAGGLHFRRRAARSTRTWRERSRRGGGYTAEVKGVLRRVVDTAGWVSADFYSQSTPSGDNVCGTDDQVIDLAAEHLEFAPTTEHNRLYDWRPHIERLGLADFLNTVSGLELTGPGEHLG